MRLIGINSTCILAGKVQLCYQSDWRLVCHYSWDVKDAMVVCQKFGFSTEGMYQHEECRTSEFFPSTGAQSCTHSCFGRNDTLGGVFNFQCTGLEDSLSECPDLYTNHVCGEVAGVICCK